MATTIGKGSGWVKGQSARLASIDNTGNKNLLNDSPENSTMVHVEKDDRNCTLQAGVLASIIFDDLFPNF
ncbi:unnamed protein product [Brugia pahangi]|uniref:Ovule protein n=1 Tax=Brugia pahangi TaxID=6280 RepID=A0A0N4SXF6_BRUPA|nr:unnamed protein product [Brugia pahangi]